MHKFWYHSPVRFYKTKEELADYTNPQNNQYFGHKEPYPLEINEYHRFLIPEFNNAIADSNLNLWVNNGSTETQLPCVFGVSDGKLKSILFSSDEIIYGNLLIKDSYGDILFYSNCVKFIDSTTTDGRKFIRIATKHTYNKKLFPFEDKDNWIVTNLPAYCLGQFSVDTDAKNSRVGGENSLRTSEAYLDEIVHYEFLAKGDANILSFIQTHVTNNYFYVDGTQRTAIDKLDADEFAMIGKLRLTNVKENGLNVSIDENDLLPELNLEVSELIPNDNFSDRFENFNGVIKLIFNTNIYFINDISKRVRVYKNNTLLFAKSINELAISNNELIINTTQLTPGDYRIIIDSGMIKNALGKEFAGILNDDDWNFSLTLEEIASFLISWEDFNDGEIVDLNGVLQTVKTKIKEYNVSASNPAVLYEWEIGTDGVNFSSSSAGSDHHVFNLQVGANYMRLKATLRNQSIIYSNILKYTRETISVVDYWFKSNRPFDSDSVDFIDKYGLYNSITLIGPHYEGNNWVDGECTLVQANQIISKTIGVVSCTPTQPPQ